MIKEIENRKSVRTFHSTLFQIVIHVYFLCIGLSYKRVISGLCQKSQNVNFPVDQFGIMIN